MRLTSGATMLRGDLRLVVRGGALTGTLALESSDGPPVALGAGRGANGAVEFAIDSPEPVSFRGRLTGGTMARLSPWGPAESARVARWNSRWIPLSR